MSNADIRANLSRIREQIAAAARRSGRSPAAVTLLGVVKGVDPARVAAAIEIGLADLAENRVQEAMRRRDALGPTRDRATWHLIGTLQTNKVRQALELFEVIHSLDRWPLATEIARRAEGRGRLVRALLQVNVSGEASKRGLAPQEVEPFLERAGQLESLRIEGLMTIAPLVSDPEQVRPVFRRLRELRDRLARRRWPNADLRELSMGMSGDFTVAVEEGATLVRIGTALFGPRPTRMADPFREEGAAGGEELLG